MHSTFAMPGLTAFRWPPHLEVWESTEKVAGLSIVLVSPSADAGLAMRPRVLDALARHAGLAPIAQAHVQRAYGASDEDMAALKMTALQLEGDEVSLIFDLPQGSPVEYLSVTFAAGDEPVRTGGGNY